MEEVSEVLPPIVEEPQATVQPSPQPQTPEEQPSQVSLQPSEMFHLKLVNMIIFIIVIQRDKTVREGRVPTI